MSQSKIESEINIFLKKFELHLIKSLPKNRNLLNQSINYSIQSGGKRFRPFLIYTFSKALKVSSKNALSIGVAVEMLHNYSLVHDDLPSMDNDNYRRGKKSTHFKFNEYTAILAGCSLLTMSYNILSGVELRLNSDRKIKLINRLAEISGKNGLLQGQFEDLNLKKLTYSDRIRINKLKTGKLMSYCVEAVGISAAIKQSDLKLLQRVGMNIGEIFQISDDFSDEPKMPTKERLFLSKYRLKLYKQTIKQLNNLKINNESINRLLNHLMELEV
jgi:geranylgeranyl pyrophosphate synthase|tara:strand:+ start:192 stop:1010 length:819 start_codon:yes stop_codon:yes gene_type:complete